MFHNTYYFLDETDFFTPYWSGKNILSRLNEWATIGRPITYIIIGLMSDMVHHFSNGILYIRLCQFTLNCVVALYLFSLLIRKGFSHLAAYILIILIWSQPVMQVYMFYAGTLPNLIGILMSYFSFRIILSKKDTLFVYAGRYFLSFILLFATCLIHPSILFCGLLPLVIDILASSEQEFIQKRKRYFIYLITVIGAGAVYIELYHLLVNFLHVNDVYFLVQQSFSFFYNGPDFFEEPLSIFNMMSRPFEWWNFPIFNTSRILINHSLSIASMIIWGSVFLIFVTAEVLFKRSFVTVEKYGTVLVAFILSLIPVVVLADFAHRQHMYIAVVPIIIIIAAFSLKTLLFRVQKVLIVILVMGFITMVIISVGAYRQVNTSIIVPRVRFLAYINQQIKSQETSKTKKILIINSDMACFFEPCEGYFGRHMDIAARSNEGSAYFYAMLFQKLTQRYDIPVEFSWSPNNSSTSDTVVIDFNRYKNCFQQK